MARGLCHLLHLPLILPGHRPDLAGLILLQRRRAGALVCRAELTAQSPAPQLRSNIRGTRLSSNSSYQLVYALSVDRAKLSEGGFGACCMHPSASSAEIGPCDNSQHQRPPFPGGPPLWQ
jgi:hypothetical protein